jgi:ACT domain-containing protein
MNDTITIRISELLKRAPKNWVKQASKIMGKKESTIYSYANGIRAKKNMDSRIQLHSILKSMIEDYEKNIDKLLN